VGVKGWGLPQGVRKLPQQEVGAPGKTESLPGVTIWTVNSCSIAGGGGGSSKVSGQGLWVPMEFR